MTKNTIKMWIETARPKTLPLALATILTGSALAYWAGSFHWGITVLCLLTTLFLQILSNFANDYGDHQHKRLHHGNIIFPSISHKLDLGVFMHTNAVF